MSSTSVVSIIGRPNVGKSTLFNRLLRKSTKALTHDIPGVTRDRNYGIMELDELNDQESVHSVLVDTGGFYPQKITQYSLKKKQREIESFFNIMKEHAELAVEESDLILFVVDIREGLLGQDQEIADFLRASGKDFWLILNKYDGDKQENDLYQFYSMGIADEKMFEISSAHGLGIDDLRTKLQKRLIQFNKSSFDVQKGIVPKSQVVANLAIIGAPNAGKSTLLNKLLKADRALVSDIAGTTVDPIEGYFDLYFGKEASITDKWDYRHKSNYIIGKEYQKYKEIFEPTLIKYGDLDGKSKPNYSSDEVDDSIESQQQSSENEVIDGQESQQTTQTSLETEGNYWRSLKIIDTAGIRRKSSIKGTIENASVFRSLRAINDCDIVIYLIDATKDGISHQDRRLIGLSLERGKSVIIVLNKMDLLKEKLKDKKTKAEWLLDIREDIPWLKHCSLLTISALTGASITQLKLELKETIISRSKSIPTSKLNKVISELIEKNTIHPAGKKSFKIKYASMVKNNPPTFLMFSNLSKDIPEHYKRYLKNGLRSNFNLQNAPIHLIFRSGKDLELRAKKV